jgi:hypothetical protein
MLGHYLVGINLAKQSNFSFLLCFFKKNNKIS